MINVTPTMSQNESLDLVNLPTEKTALEIQHLDLFYGSKQALFDVNMKIPKGQVTAFIGPSGCGKSTLLRCINRMNDLVEICHIKGAITLQGQNIYDKSVDVAALRRRVGMVFQRPNPFPKSIYENVVYGLRLQGINDRRLLDAAVERSLRGAALWEEVKDRLHENAFGLSGGQQQRLVIARAIAIKPRFLLFDEPTSALDPRLTSEVLDVMRKLAEEGSTMVVVTHEMDFARKVANWVVYMEDGVIVEEGPSKEFFSQPKSEKTMAFLHMTSSDYVI